MAAATTVVDTTDLTPEQTAAHITTLIAPA